MRFSETILPVALALLAACGPSAQQKAKVAEEQRSHCLDHRCEGDVEPPRNVADEEALKFNGRWFIGPKEYFSGGINGASFLWWEHKPLSRRMPIPAELQQANASGRGGEFSIEIFLRHDDGRPFGPSRYERLLRSEREGRLLDKKTLRPGLEQWRTQELDNQQSDVWYVATEHVGVDPNGAVLSCREVDPAYARCSSGFIWSPGVVGDTRFRAKHATDWPEIYEEIQRVLSLLKKA